MGPVNRRRLILLGLPLFLFAASLFVWHRIDTRPAAWDESVHLLLALDYRDLLKDGTPVTTSWASVYPPLYHLSIIPALSLGQPSPAKAVATYVLYAALMLAGFILLTRGFGRSTEEGVVAALLFWSMPIVFFTSRRPLLDFPLSALVCFGMACLWRTKRFTDPRYSFIWGVVSGLGLLIKPFYPIPFLLPSLLLLYQGGFKWRNFGLGLGATLLVSLPWYGWQGPLFLRNVVNIAGEVGAAEDDPTAGSLAGWLFYFRGLWDQCGLVGLTLLLAGLVMALVRYKRVKGVAFLGAWILSSYLVQTLEHNKDIRYTMPLLAALCLWSAAGWMSWADNARRRLMGLGLAGILFIGSAWSFDKPRRENWAHSEIAATMAANKESDAPFILATVLSNHMSLFGRGIRLSLRERGMTMFTQPCGDPQADFTQFVVIKTGDLGPMADGIRREQDHLLQSGRSFHKLFRSLLEVPLPDGSKATLYGRDNEHRFEVGPISKESIESCLTRVLKPLIQGPFYVQIVGEPKEWKRGHFAEIRITGGPVIIRDVPIRLLDLQLREVWLNLYQLWDHQAPGLLAFESLAPKVVVTAEDLQALLAKRAKGVENLTLQFVDRKVKAKARYKRIPLEVRASLGLVGNPPHLEAYAERASIAKIPLPLFILAKARRQAVPLDPVPSFPGRLVIRHVTLAENTLTIEP